MTETLWDAPNQQAVGLDPPWVEGAGGEPGMSEPAGPKATEAPVASQGGSVDLDAMTKAELLAYAQSIGVSPANNDMLKEELRAAVDAHLAVG